MAAHADGDSRTLGANALGANAWTWFFPLVVVRPHDPCLLAPLTPTKTQMSKLEFLLACGCFWEGLTWPLVKMANAQPERFLDCATQLWSAIVLEINSAPRAPSAAEFQIVLQFLRCKVDELKHNNRRMLFMAQ